MQCDRISATRAFITQLGERDVRHMIIGPGCSSGAVIVAENAPFRSLTQVSISIYLILKISYSQRTYQYYSLDGLLIIFRPLF